MSAKSASMRNSRAVSCRIDYAYQQQLLEEAAAMADLMQDRTTPSALEQRIALAVTRAAASMIRTLSKDTPLQNERDRSLAVKAAKRLSSARAVLLRRLGMDTASKQATQTCPSSGVLQSQQLASSAAAAQSAALEAEQYAACTAELQQAYVRLMTAPCTAAGIAEKTAAREVIDSLQCQLREAGGVGGVQLARDMAMRARTGAAAVLATGKTQCFHSLQRFPSISLDSEVKQAVQGMQQSTDPLVYCCLCCTLNCRSRASLCAGCRLRAAHAGVRV